MLRYPRDPSKHFIKRIVGLEGETISLRDGIVFVDGRRIEERFIAPDGRSRDSWGPARVPDRHYFVWAIAGTTALTAGTGASCHVSTSSGVSDTAGGRCGGAAA